MQQQKKYQITVQPITEPITLSEAREHLRNEGLTADDDYINTLIVTARKWVEQYTSRALINQTWVQSWDVVPSKAVFELAVNPLVSITSFQYYDENGNSQNYTTYQTDTQSEQAILCPDYNTTFPSIQLGRLNAINLTFVCGYGTAADVPGDIKHAIKIMLAYFYDENRSGVVYGVKSNDSSTFPKIVEYLLTNYRLTGL